MKRFIHTMRVSQVENREFLLKAVEMNESLVKSLLARLHVLSVFCYSDGHGESLCSYENQFSKA